MNRYKLTLHRQVSDGQTINTHTLFMREYEPKQATPFDECKVSDIAQLQSDDIKTIFATVSLVNGNGEDIVLSSQLVKVTDKGFTASTRLSVPALNGFVRLSANFAHLSKGAYQANLSMTEVGTMVSTRAAILAANRPVNSAMKRAQREIVEFKQLSAKLAQIKRMYEGAINPPADEVTI